MSSRPAASIRTQIIVIVLAGAIIPLALAGYWLTSSAVRSGRNLLREHLAGAADRFVKLTSARWQYRSEDLELVARNAVSQRVVEGVPMTGADSLYLAGLAADLSGWVLHIELRDASGRSRWSWSPEAGSTRGSSPVDDPVVEVRRPVNGLPGEVLVRIPLGALIPADSGRPVVAGSRIALRQQDGAVLIPLDPEVAFPEHGEVDVNGAPWFAERRRVEGPGIELAVAAPLSSYVAPFERGERFGFAALVLVTIFAIGLTAFLTTRLTGSVRVMADAAGAVAQGDLEHRVEGSGPRELRSLAASFNAMTESLRRTLAELSERSALAAVGEFATSLSHEVRNALTSVKVDLQRAARRNPPDASSQALVERALGSVARLEGTVTGALRVARSGKARGETVDLRDVLRSAANAVGGSLAAVPATLDLEMGSQPRSVRGDPAALEQLFVNLLFNAAQAVRPGGHVKVQMGSSPERFLVSVADDGIGMTPATLERVSSASYSTKPNGSGLGLPIARRIASAHGGELRISSTPGSGTRVEVELPMGVPHVLPNDPPPIPIAALPED